MPSVTSRTQRARTRTSYDTPAAAPSSRSATTDNFCAYEELSANWILPAPPGPSAGGVASAAAGAGARHLHTACGLPWTAARLTPRTSTPASRRIPARSTAGSPWPSSTLSHTGHRDFSDSHCSRQGPELECSVLPVTGQLLGLKSQSQAPPCDLSPQSSQAERMLQGHGRLGELATHTDAALLRLWQPKFVDCGISRRISFGTVAPSPESLVTTTGTQVPDPGSAPGLKCPVPPVPAGRPRLNCPVGRARARLTSSAQSRAALCVAWFGSRACNNLCFNLLQSSLSYSVFSYSVSTNHAHEVASKNLEFIKVFRVTCNLRTRGIRHRQTCSTVQWTCP